MEDLFDILLVVIVAIIGAVAKSKKSQKKKKSPDRPAPVPAAEPITEPAKPITQAQKALSQQNLENAVAAFSELLDAHGGLPTPEKHEQTSIEAELSKPAQPKVKRKKKKLSSGESATDDHGCIGGSMPVHNAEGESLAEHAAHEENRRQHLQQNAPAVAVETLRRPSNQELRRAIVMSEVLDKPVSLRGRRI